MAWNTILFDLDGTLTDPKEGITKSAAYALEYFGLHEPLDALTKFIGPPLDESFSEFYGFDEAQTRLATEKFREYFTRQGWQENIPYPGIDRLLQALRLHGKTLLVATSKAEPAAVRILEYFGLASYFHQIGGAALDHPEGAKKAVVIRDVLARAGIVDYSGVIMVGDRRHDVAGAHEAGIPSIGVLYGYGSRMELLAAGADFIVEDIPSLEKRLLSTNDISIQEP